MIIKRSQDIEHKLPLNKTLEEYPYSLSDKVFHTNQLFLYSEKVLPGRRASAEHFHRSIDEIIYVTKGELVAHEGENKTTLKVGDGVCFMANSEQFHYLENCSSEEAEFLIFRRTTKSNDIVYKE